MPTGLSELEAERLARLMQQAFAHRERGWSAAELRALAGQPGVAVVATPNGFGMVRTAADETEILTLAVAPAVQGQGHGRALLDGLLAAARAAGSSRVFLEVGEGNAAARRLYAAAGFAEAARRRGYLRLPDGSREDALVLCRDL